MRVGRAVERTWLSSAILDLVDNYQRWQGGKPSFAFFPETLSIFQCLAAGRYAFNGDARAIPKAFLIDASATKE
jgi:hypothetical protein